MNYRIIPLVLTKYWGEKGAMTFLTDYGTPVIRPFVMWYIEGLEENVLVDTGIEADDYRNYDPRFRDLEMDTLMTFEEALESVNLTPEKIDVVIQTHLHFDHCFNTKKCKNARVMVQEAELKFAQNPAPFEGLYRKALYEGLNFEMISGDHSLFPGLDLLFVPGHSAGGQAVSVETEKGRALISGLCSLKENFYPEKTSPMAGDDSTLLPGIMLNAVQAYQSVKRMKEAADILLSLHDPEVLELTAIP